MVMVEMQVRTVDHCARSGQPVALLLPREREAGAPVTVPIEASAACSLSHELEGLSTPRTRAYALLLQAVHAVGGYIAAIMLVPGPSGDPAAQLRVGMPHRWDDQPIAISEALGLAVHTTLPILVSGVLAQVEPTPGASTAPSSDLDGQHGPHAQTTVPAAFLQALNE
jgi:bifunctional DNase/RNase